MAQNAGVRKFATNFVESVYRKGYTGAMKRLRLESEGGLRVASSEAVAVASNGRQVVIEDASGRSRAIVGSGPLDIFGPDDAVEDEDSETVRLIASSGSVDFGQSWRS